MPIPVYFGFRVASGLVLLKLSTQFLPVQDFASFAQLLAFSSLLNMAVVGGAQNGLIRQAAAANDAELADVHGAGLAIWVAALPLLGIPVLLFSPQISHILTGSRDYWQVVIGLAALSMASGPVQICWSILSGRKRVAQSLGLQTGGTLIGTAAAAFLIVRGNVAGAALAFAAGPLVATAATIPLVRGLPLAWRPTTRGLGRLIGYSAAIAATLAFSSFTLFALRWAYRDHFGTTQLGYWLAANRISDMSTQFLGLFMLQAFVPQIARTSDPLERSRLIFRYGVAGAVLMAMPLIVFLVAGTPLVHLFLSESYVAAIPSIRLYMIGDLLRVWVSLAMFTAFATGRPSGYAAIEICTMTLMAAVTLVLIRSGELWAPQIAYAVAFGTSALALGAALAFRIGQLHPRRWRLRGGRRIYLPGSALRLP